MSLAVLSIGLTGALTAFQAGAREARLGQTRQMKLMLADAAIQRVRLQDKANFFAGLPARPVTNIANVAVGAAPWTRDAPPVSGDPLDFSQGAYFKILPDGTLTRVSVAGNPPCSDPLVLPGTICREVYVHRNGPFGSTDVTSQLPAGSSAATVWVRVTTKRVASQLPEVDVVLNQVVVR